MKKLISAMLAVVFCLTLTVTAMVPVSAASDNPTNGLLADPTTAADGTLLYKVQFGYTHGVYQSHEIDRDAANQGVLTIHDDEYGITFTLPADYDHSTQAKKWWYGDSIDGLTLAEGNRYTIRYKIRSNENSVDNARGTGNNGFFFNTDASGLVYDSSYGSYGNLTCVKSAGPFYDLFRKGSHVSGDHLSSGKYIYFNSESTRDVPVPDADGYVDCKVEVDGFKYHLYINDKFFDCTTIAENDQAIANNLGVIFYTYSSCGSLKDVEIYKGLTDAEPEVKVTTAEGETTKDPYAEDPIVTTTTDVTTTDEPNGTTTPDATTTETPKVNSTTEAPKDDEKGCAGVALVAQVVAILGCAVSFVVIRKKH